MAARKLEHIEDATIVKLYRPIKGAYGALSRVADALSEELEEEVSAALVLKRLKQLGEYEPYDRSKPRTQKREKRNIDDKYLIGLYQEKKGQYGAIKCIAKIISEKIGERVPTQTLIGRLKKAGVYQPTRQRTK